MRHSGTGVQTIKHGKTSSGGRCLHRSHLWAALPITALLVFAASAAVYWRYQRTHSASAPLLIRGGSGRDLVPSLRTRRCMQQFREVVMRDFSSEALARSQQDMRAQQELQGRVEAHISSQQPGLNMSQIEGHSGRYPQKQALYWALATEVECVQQVCEIGFNAGHSATVWLAARPDIVVHSFDLGRHNYTYTAIEYFAKTMPGRLVITLGDSTKTIPEAVRRGSPRCDVLVVDGGHTYDIAAADIINGVQLAHPLGGFTAFLIDDVMCPEWWCQGPERALNEAEQGGLVTIVRRLSEWSNVVSGRLNRKVLSGVAAGWVGSTRVLLA